MIIPLLTIIRHNDFETSEDIYKIIVHEGSITFGSFELNRKPYYLGWISPDIIQAELKLLEKENYLLVGVDLRAVVLCVNTGKILFSIGLFSFFKGFVDTNELHFTILTELQDIVVNKNGLSISQIISHDLEF